jgi:hypothetical protein
MPGYQTGSTARQFPFFWRTNGFIHPLDFR